MARSAALVLLVLLSAGGCRAVEDPLAPSHNRDWQPCYAVLPSADIRGNEVTLHDVRHCKHVDADTYVVDWYDKQFQLGDIRAVDFGVMPFKEMPALAHTLISFEIDDGHGKPDYVAVSVECRKEKGEEYSALAGAAGQYELMYVVADERDVIASATNFRDQPVYLYRSTATPAVAQELFRDVMERVNQIKERPEFYDTLTNNCTTNIVRHINRIRPNRVVYDYRVLLPGLSAELAYQEGLIEQRGTFAETRAAALVNAKAERFATHPDFSQLIRR